MYGSLRGERAPSPGCRRAAEGPRSPAAALGQLNVSWCRHTPKEMAELVLPDSQPQLYGAVADTLFKCGTRQLSWVPYLDDHATIVTEYLISSTKLCTHQQSPPQAPSPRCPRSAFLLRICPTWTSHRQSLDRATHDFCIWLPSLDSVHGCPAPWWVPSLGLSSSTPL